MAPGESRWIFASIASHAGTLNSCKSWMMFTVSERSRKTPNKGLKGTERAQKLVCMLTSNPTGSSWNRPIQFPVGLWQARGAPWAAAITANRSHLSSLLPPSQASSSNSRLSFQGRIQGAFQTQARRKMVLCSSCELCGQPSLLQVSAIWTRPRSCSNFPFCMLFLCVCKYGSKTNTHQKIQSVVGKPMVWNLGIPPFPCKYMSSRQSPLHLSNHYHHGYRVWGAISLSCSVCISDKSASAILQWSSTILTVTYMFLETCYRAMMV